MKAKKMTGKRFKEIVEKELNYGFPIDYEHVLAILEEHAWIASRECKGEHLQKHYREAANNIHDELEKYGYWDECKAEA